MLKIKKIVQVTSYNPNVYYLPNIENVTNYKIFDHNRFGLPSL